MKKSKNLSHREAWKLMKYGAEIVAHRKGRDKKTVILRHKFGQGLQAIVDQDDDWSAYPLVLFLELWDFFEPRMDECSRGLQ